MVKLSLLVTVLIKPLALPSLSLSPSLLSLTYNRTIRFVLWVYSLPPPPHEPRDNNRTPVQPVTVILILLEQCRNSYAVFNCYCD